MAEAVCGKGVSSLVPRCLIIGLGMRVGSESHLQVGLQVLCPLVQALLLLLDLRHCTQSLLQLPEVHMKQGGDTPIDAVVRAATGLISES